MWADPEIESQWNSQHDTPPQWNSYENNEEMEKKNVLGEWQNMKQNKPMFI